MEKTRRRDAVHDAIAGLLLALASILLYRKALRLWWCWDDAYNLHMVLTHRVADFFVRRELWPQRLFTPILMASYGGLIRIAGFDAAHWYGAAIALLAAAAIGLYAALRLYLRPSLAFAGALLFVGGPPLTVLATQLMAMHYSESLAAGALAFITFVIALRRRNMKAAVLSAAFYLVAILAKEIAVPLIAFLALLPEGTIRQRLRSLAPHLVVLVAYAGWRFAVLGTMFGGYGWAVRPDERGRVIALTPWKVLQACAGNTGSAGVALLVGTAALLALRFGGRGRILLVVALLLAVAPIVPVSKEMQPRYAVAAWLVLSAAFPFAIASLPPRRGAAAAAVILAAALASGRVAWSREYRSARRMSDEARAGYELEPGALLRHPAIPPAAMGELQWLKEQYFHRPAGALWFYDDLFLCSTPVERRRMFEYSESTHRVAEIREPSGIARSYCASIRRDAVLTAAFRYSGDVLSWSLGPYETGQYALTIANGIESFIVPRRDAFRLPAVRGLTLRVRYVSPTGWVTYSDEIALDFVHHPELQWAR